MRDQNTRTEKSRASGHPRQGFEDSEGLRALLNRLHSTGRAAWRTAPEVAALM